MNLNEVKIGDLVTFATEKGKKVKGKVIHRHTDADKQHLMGHVNVQVDDEGSYPHTVHVSKLKKITEEATMEDMKENIAGFVQAILAGENTDAQAMLDNILGDKINTTLSALKVEVAGQMFAAESFEDDDDMFITEDEFAALSPEEQAEYEIVEFENDAIEEGMVKAANKAKKNAYTDSLTDKPRGRPDSLIRLRGRIRNKAAQKWPQNGERVPGQYNRLFNAIKKRIANAPTVKNEGIIAPRPTPSPEATAAAKTDIEKAKKKREDALAAAKAELDSTSKSDLKKALYSKMYKNEEVEMIDELSKKTLGSYVTKAAKDIQAKSYGSGVHDYVSHPTDWSKKNNKKIEKRQDGIKTATDKLTKENVEMMSEEEYDSYRDYHMGRGTWDKEKEHVRAGRGISWGKHKPVTAKKPEEPHSVHINGKKWKSFSSHGHATNVAKKLMAKKGEGHKVTVEKD